MFMMFTISVWIALYLVNLFILDYDSGIQAAPPSHQPTSPPAHQPHQASKPIAFLGKEADDSPNGRLTMIRPKNEPMGPWVQGGAPLR